MRLSVHSSDVKLDVNDSVFGRDFNSELVHQIVVAYAAGGRAGSRAQRSRAEVKASGRKPWRQKGTGRARAGSRASPIMRGGGVTFAAKPADHSQKVNRRMYRHGLCAILSRLVADERLQVVENLSVGEAKTAKLRVALESLLPDGAPMDALLVVEQQDESLARAARNLPHVAVSEVKHLNPVILLKHRRVIVTVDALKRLEAWLSS